MQYTKGNGGNRGNMKRKEHYMQVALLTSKRSTCNTKVGAVAIKDNRIIMTAYNGSPRGMKHCTDAGCYEVTILSENQDASDYYKEEFEHCIRTVHAEQNIITQCAKHGISLQDAEIYCTHEPCMECQKLLISSGVKIVYYNKDYKDERLLDEYKNFIDLRKLKC